MCHSDIPVELCVLDDEFSIIDHFMFSCHISEHNRTGKWSLHILLLFAGNDSSNYRHVKRRGGPTAREDCRVFS